MKFFSLHELLCLQISIGLALAAVAFPFFGVSGYASYHFLTKIGNALQHRCSFFTTIIIINLQPLTWDKEKPYQVMYKWEYKQASKQCESN